MKIRIQGNSIRVRLSRPEVEKLSRDSYIEEKTFFGNNSFCYALKQDVLINALSATYSDNNMTMYVPKAFLEKWPENNVVGIDSEMPVGKTETLYLLLEKDFKCLDNVAEDQSDNYENPNKSC